MATDKNSPSHTDSVKAPDAEATNVAVMLVFVNAATIFLTISIKKSSHKKGDTLKHSNQRHASARKKHAYRVRPKFIKAHSYSTAFFIQSWRFLIGSLQEICS